MAVRARCTASAVPQLPDPRTAIRCVMFPSRARCATTQAQVAAMAKQDQRGARSWRRYHGAEPGASAIRRRQHAPSRRSNPATRSACARRRSRTPPRPSRGQRRQHGKTPLAVATPLPPLEAEPDRIDVSDHRRHAGRNAVRSPPPASSTAAAPFPMSTIITAIAMRKPAGAIDIRGADVAAADAAQVDAPQPSASRDNRWATIRSDSRSGRRKEIHESIDL